MRGTTLDAVDIVYGVLKDSSLTITGGIHKYAKPISSNLEDVVVNSITMNNEQLQEGVLVVNIHVPDKQIKVGTTTQSMIDTKRMLSVSKEVLSVLNEVWKDDWHFVVQQQNLIESTGEHFNSIRLEFYFENN